MTTNWNLTSDLVADRRAARESAAQRHRLLSKARRGQHFFRRTPAVDIESAVAPVTAHNPGHTTAPTTGPTPQRAAA
jgi:hypothetical protein